MSVSGPNSAAILTAQSYAEQDNNQEDMLMNSSQPHIALVNDDPNFLTLLEELLAEERYKVSIL